MADRQQRVTVWPEERLRDRLNDFAAKHGVVGAATGISCNGDTLTAVTGTASLATEIPVARDTLFQLGSVTKTYTATLVMQLVGDGLVELDAPIKSYIPDLELGDATATNVITVRQLLAHTSGLEGDHFEGFGRGDDAIEKYVASCSDIPQLHEPGEMMSYSNAGYVILGLLVERIRGMPFNVALAHHLLSPAGLFATLSYPEDILLRRFAIGHLPHPSERGRMMPSPIWAMSPSSAPAGSMLCATIDDLLSFAGLHIRDGKAPDGTSVLAGEFMRAMREPQVEVPDKYTFGDAWGLGWMLFNWDGTDVIGHDGASIGQASFLRVIPEHNVAVGLFTNGGDGRGLYEDLLREFLADALPITMPTMPQPSRQGAGFDLSRYAARYERLGFAVELRVDEGGLAFESEVTGALARYLPPIPPATLSTVSETLFLIPPAHPAGRPIPVVFYSFDGDGRPRWAHAGGRAMRRVGV